MSIKNEGDLDLTLKALADPTRRELLQRLADGDARVTELAEPFPISLNSVSKHIRMLERAGLVTRQRRGREHVLSLNPQPLDDVAAWVESQRAYWAAKLGDLDKLLKEEDAQPMVSDSQAVAQVTHQFDASPERVFDAWLNPDTVRRWFAPGMGELGRIEVDARVGGWFSFVDRRDGEDIDHIGQYLEIDRPRRLAFTWAIRGVEGDISQVTIDIVPLGDGCELTLTHEMDSEWADFVESAENSWILMLNAMHTALSETPA